MFKYITMFMLIGINLLSAENIQATQVTQSINKLEANNQILALQLEAIELKKRIIEMENFIEKNQLKKERESKRASAIARFRSELRASRNRSRQRQVSNYAHYR